MTNFQEIRRELTSSNYVKEREEIAEKALTIKLVSAVAIVGGIGVAALGSYNLKNHKSMGSLLVFVGLVSSVIFKESYSLSSNLERIASSSLINRVKVTWSSRTFMEELFKGTWVLKPLFGELFIRELDKSN